MAATKKTATTTPDPSPKDSSKAPDETSGTAWWTLRELLVEARTQTAVLREIRDRLPKPQTSTVAFGMHVPDLTRCAPCQGSGFNAKSMECEACLGTGHNPPLPRKA